MHISFRTYRLLLLLGFWFCTVSALAERYYTRSLVSNIKTVKADLQGSPLSDPIITLGGGEQLLLSFDEMSYNTKTFNYSIVHCNADWTPSELSEVEYINGAYSGTIDDYEQSVSTTVLYTNYQLLLPNDDVDFKISGNYAVVVYEDNDREHPVATICFSVVDPLVAIEADVRSNTDVELSRRFQQVDFTLDTDGVELSDPFSELKVFVLQNGRYDNAATNLKPTYTSLGKHSYVNNPQLIFEGGNEYRSIDFSSVYTYGSGIQQISFDKQDEVYHVELLPDVPRNEDGYSFMFDADGKYVINRQHSDYSRSEADYMWVHFSVPKEDIRFDGLLYVLGSMQGNMQYQIAPMDYNFETRCYEKSLFLKQGGYNYMYLFFQKGETKGTLQYIEGSYWQTLNTYQILVYYCPRGSRYDQLIGVKELKKSF
ncbi:MAG: DUF5103 domain-containing protein [Paludibacteraceae bacterium]|nr:DUF5103 domain-containing protein [Paludibacteraceae bacterium]